VATARLSQSQRESLEKDASRFETDLPNSPAMDYLDGRGVTSLVASTFRLGYDREQSMLAIPYLTPAGVVNMKWRRLDDEQPKYLGLPGAPTRLFNVLALSKAQDGVAICEGELDAITLDGCVGVPAVGVSGTTAWRPFYGRIFEGYRHVWIFADNDRKDDGSNPGWELVKAVLKSVPHATPVSLPPNVDVNQLYLNEGAEAVRSLIATKVGA